jgi:hypothetical protein
MAGKTNVKPKVPEAKPKPTPEPKPAPPSHNEQLLKSLLVLIAHQSKSLTLVDFAADWLIDEVIKVSPEGEEIIVSLIKKMIANENHDGLCTILNSLNEYGSWLEDMRPTPRKELLDILTGVAQRFWENKSMVNTISYVFAQVPNEAIDTLREAEIDNDSFDYIVKKMFVFQNNQ